MKKKWMFVILLFPTIFVIGLIIYNWINNNKFWVASATTCLSLLFAAILSFYFVQRQTDFRSQKGLLIKLLESLLIIVDDEKSHNFSNESKEQILMRKREINNKIEILREFEKKFSISDDVQFLDSKFSEYEDTIGNHINDLETLRKMNDDLERPLKLMSQCIYRIMIELYN